MIESLTEIEIAYNLLKSSDSAEESDSSDPFDVHYRKLNTKIEPVDQGTEEFKLLSDYVENTHGQTHSHYKLKIEEVIRVFVYLYCLKFLQFEHV